MTVSRDSVNRAKDLVCLPNNAVSVDTRISAGDSVVLENVDETHINAPYELDPMEMREPLNGNAVGDAIFDAMDGDPDILDAMQIGVLEVIGEPSVPMALGYILGGVTYMLDTGWSVPSNNEER